jgi:hypothetical protein
MKKIVPRVTVTSRKIKPIATAGEVRRPCAFTGIKEFSKKCPQLVRWLRPLSRWSQRVISVSELKRGYKVRLYTANHIYYITAIPQKYLGCIVVSRRARVGEDWFRGNDLRDGKWSRATWQKILADIVSYELEPEGSPSWGNTVKEMQGTCHAKH